MPPIRRIREPLDPIIADTGEESQDPGDHPNLAYHIAEQVKLTAMQSAIGPTQRTHRTRLAAMHHDTIISFCPNPAAFHAATSYDFPAPTKDRDLDYWKQWAAANTAYQQHITTPMLRTWAAHILDYVQQPTYRVEPSDPPAAR